jgi:hypothetical protein
MTITEKKNAKVVLTQEEMFRLCDAYRLLSDIRWAMENNDAKYIDCGVGAPAYDRDTLGEVIEVIDNITSPAFNPDVNGFELEIGNDF